MRHIVFQGNKYNRVIFNIRGDAPFHDILKKVNGLSLTDCRCDEENGRYALLELLNNSLRAHREKSITEKIHTKIIADDDAMRITITDRGGGFDPAGLPYDIESPIDEIDTDSIAFQEYREATQYTRFGMGLLTARRVFTGFDLCFLDADDRLTEWKDGNAVGTRINLAIGWNDV
jgi:anti-sigma regulatory factor (Ser/Thr protein kinase)